MIDFVRIYFTDKEQIDKFVRDGRRKSTIQRQSKDGKDITYTVWLHNLKLVSTPKTTYLEGSLHSFYNAVNGITSDRKKQKWVNHNDFTFSDLLKVLDILKKKLNYDLSQTKITICEFGLNVVLDIPPKEFLEKHVLMYKLRYPCYDPKYKDDMKMKKCDLENYYLKMYDKSLQFGLSENILRYEIGFKSDELKECDIQSLEDLRDECKIELLYNSYMKKYEDLLIVDYWKGNPNMPKKDRQKMPEYTNPQFWIENKGKYNNRSRHKAEFKKIIRENKLEMRKSYLRTLLIQKYNYLILN
jgi:hypothetical protein